MPRERNRGQNHVFRDHSPRDCATAMNSLPTQDAPFHGNFREVFGAFLRLGLTSFGGPIAHMAYFHEEFVTRRRWLDESAFARLLALCQFVPGPASSQLGFAIGLRRAGWRGALAAFVAFTLPSALLMLLFALSAAHLGSEQNAPILHGLKLVAVVFVAHGLIGMARRFLVGLPHVLIAVITMVMIVLASTAWMQLAAILFGALLGVGRVREAIASNAAAANRTASSMRAGWAWFGVFLLGLVLALAWPSAGPDPGSVVAAFYRAGALVFGGGHVVLPLLQEELVGTGWMRADDFLAGYGAAQALPGPMFSIAAYLGADSCKAPDRCWGPGWRSWPCSCRASCCCWRRCRSGNSCCVAPGRCVPWPG